MVCLQLVSDSRGLACTNKVHPAGGSPACISRLAPPSGSGTLKVLLLPGFHPPATKPDTFRGMLKAVVLLPWFPPGWHWASYGGILNHHKCGVEAKHGSLTPTNGSSNHYTLQNDNKCIETLDNPLLVNICKQLSKADTEEQIKGGFRRWRDGSVGKSTCCETFQSAFGSPEST